MAKIELTQEEKDFKLDGFTLNKQFVYWLVKSKCMWNLKETNEAYDLLREENDHSGAFEKLKKRMFELGIK